MYLKTGCLGIIACLAVSAAAASEGRLQGDTLACRDQSIVLGLAEVIKNSSVAGFDAHVASLKASGQCAKFSEGQRVTFIEANGAACLSTVALQPCYWSVLVPQAVQAETTGRAPAR